MRLPATISLNDRQTTFVQVILSGTADSAVEAARLAGYANPSSDGYRLLQVPTIQAAIEQELRRRLAGELAPLAFRFLEAVLRDKEAKFGERVRLDAAKLLIDRAGYVPPRQSESTAGEAKEPEQMTTQELHDLVIRLDQEIMDRAVVVPSEQDIDPQLVDLL